MLKFPSREGARRQCGCRGVFIRMTNTPLHPSQEGNRTSPPLLLRIFRIINSPFKAGNNGSANNRSDWNKANRRPAGK